MQMPQTWSSPHTNLSMHCGSWPLSLMTVLCNVGSMSFGIDFFFFCLWLFSILSTFESKLNRTALSGLTSLITRSSGGVVSKVTQHLGLLAMLWQHHHETRDVPRCKGIPPLWHEIETTMMADWVLRHNTCTYMCVYDLLIASTECVYVHHGLKGEKLTFGMSFSFDGILKAKSWSWTSFIRSIIGFLRS